MATPPEWTPADAAGLLAVPGVDDDKYSRGVLGVLTGSDRYPGAAVLGVEAALRTGVGMVRYVGPPRAADLVLARRPEAVTAPGRVQAWLIGSGMDAATRDPAPLTAALADGVPVVLDAGALDLVDAGSGPRVITPHHGELAALTGRSRADIAGDPIGAARAAADALGVTVLLKGHTTVAAGAGGVLLARSAPTWLATAGSGDALAGILGALVATHAAEVAEDAAVLTRLAATAAVLHGLAGARASGGGPVTILDLCAALPATIARLVAARRV